MRLEDEESDERSLLLEDLSVSSKTSRERRWHRRPKGLECLRFVEHRS